MRDKQAFSRPERLVRLASWLVALLFAGLLVNLGQLVLRDLFQVPDGGPPRIEPFQQQAGLTPLQQQQQEQQHQLAALYQQHELLSTTRSQLQRQYQTERQSLNNWLQSRQPGSDAGQNDEVLKRTRALDALQADILGWQRREDALERQRLRLEAQQRTLAERIASRSEGVTQRYQQALQAYELKVFALRLAVLLPLLLLALWLFGRYRKHRYWFFVYGFGLAALFAFFVELVPYLPSFGGYIRLLVGIALTVYAGTRMMQAFQRYAERKRAELQQSQNERARHIGYAVAQQAFQKKLCPSCDHHYAVAGDDADYCVHCGLQLFRTCGCGARNFAFFPYCKRCGAAVSTPTDSQQTQQVSP